MTDAGFLTAGDAHMDFDVRDRPEEQGLGAGC
jgi:hypothetical protein